MVARLISDVLLFRRDVQNKGCKNKIISWQDCVERLHYTNYTYTHSLHNYVKGQGGQGKCLNDFALCEFEILGRTPSCMSYM